MTRQQRAARAYGAGSTTREIADQLGVHESTVRRWLTATGTERRRLGPRGRTDVTDDLILTLRDVEQLSWAVIAEEVRMSPTGVRNRYLAATGQTRPERDVAPPTAR